MDRKRLKFILYLDITMVNKKKFFPKFKKKLSSFLTDESGKITKKDALGLAAGALLLWSAGDVEAAHTNGPCGHVSQWHASWYTPWGHKNWYAPWGHVSQTAVDAKQMSSQVTGTKTSHSSWIVNWHYSWTPNWWHVSWYNQWGHVNQVAVNGKQLSTPVGGWVVGSPINQPPINGVKHCSHSSHGNHSSWWWC